MPAPGYTDPNTTPLTIGDSAIAIPQLFSGYLDELALWNIALGPSDRDFSALLSNGSL